MDQQLKSKHKGKRNNVLVHILLWGMIFILPYFFMDSERIFNWKPFIRSLPEMLGFMLVFYMNYFLLIDKLLYKISIVQSNITIAVIIKNICTGKL